MGAKKQTKGRVGRRQRRQAPRRVPPTPAEPETSRASPPIAFSTAAGRTSAARVQSQECKGGSPRRKKNSACRQKNPQKSLDFPPPAAYNVVKINTVANGEGAREQMRDLGYYNGRFGAVEEMTVPFNDRVHFFGDGVYDVTYTRNHIPFALDEHLDRFYRSAAMLDIRIPHEKQELRAIILDMVRRVDSGEQFVYLQATRGTQPRDHVYPEDMHANIWIMLRPQTVKDVFHEVRAITAEDTRFFHNNIKTLNLIPAVMYAQMAKRAGVYETILYRKPDRVTECAHANVHILNRDGVFQTAPTDELILPGIARAHLIRACRALGVAVSETPFTLTDLMQAREVIISSSSAFGLRCVEIDGQPVGGGDAGKLRSIQQWVLDEFLRETEG